MLEKCNNNWIFHSDGEKKIVKCNNCAILIFCSTLLCSVVTMNLGFCEIYSNMHTQMCEIEKLSNVNVVSGIYVRISMVDCCPSYLYFTMHMFNSMQACFLTHFWIIHGNSWKNICQNVENSGKSFIFCLMRKMKNS